MAPLQPPLENENPAWLLTGLLFTTGHCAEPLVIPLWPEGVPGAQPEGGAEYVQDGLVYNVQIPTLTYLPAPADKRARAKRARARSPSQGPEKGSGCGN